MYMGRGQRIESAQPIFYYHFESVEALYRALRCKQNTAEHLGICLVMMTKYRRQVIWLRDICCGQVPPNVQPVPDQTVQAQIVKKATDMIKVFFRYAPQKRCLSIREWNENWFRVIHIMPPNERQIARKIKSCISRMERRRSGRLDFNLSPMYTERELLGFFESIRGA